MALKEVRLSHDESNGKLTWAAWIDTDHIGVIIVHIHDAKDLKATDRRTGRSENPTILSME